MSASPTDDASSAAALRGAREACERAASRLAEAGVATESLAEFVPERRRLLMRKPATMRHLGDVWRIGPILLGADGSLYAGGRATRAAERPRPNYQSVSREERRDIAAAALAGGYAAGTPVNFDAVPIPFGSEAVGDAASAGGEAGGSSEDGEEAGAAHRLPPGSPVVFSNGEVRVRWHPTAPLTTAPTLAAFLEDRVGLLVDPPLGST